MKGYEYVENPHPPGHKLNPRRLEQHDKWLYYVVCDSPGTRMGDMGSTLHVTGGISTKEAAESECERWRAKQDGAAYYVASMPLDFVAVDDP